MVKDRFGFFGEVACFTKQSLRTYFGVSEFALNERIKRALKNKEILEIKKGLYVTRVYFLNEPQKTQYKEFIASKLRFPSYLSKEYVLGKYGLLTEATYAVTSITVKVGRSYQNFLGSYIYFNLNRKLFFGFEEKEFYKNKYFIASKAKALFDFLYLKDNLPSDDKNLEEDIIEGLRINWENFNKKDFNLFRRYVLTSESKKMNRILKILEAKL